MCVLTLQFNEELVCHMMEFRKTQRTVMSQYVLPAGGVQWGRGGHCALSENVPLLHPHQEEEREDWLVCDGACDVVEEGWGWRGVQSDGVQGRESREGGGGVDECAPAA